MAVRNPFIPTKTYSTEKNAEDAVQKIYGNDRTVHFIVVRNLDGRYVPICLHANSVHAGTHFHFHTIAG